MRLLFNQGMCFWHLDNLEGSVILQLTLLIIRFFRFLSFGCENEPSIMVDIFLHVTKAMRLIKCLSL